MTSTFYAGIGSRKTPRDILEYMRLAGERLAKRGLVLRSGAAEGADAAFEKGCVGAGGKAEIWLPWEGFNRHAKTGYLPSASHIETASTLHPAWVNLDDTVRLLHARNVGQVWGADLASPVSFVLCWTPDGCESEATRSKDTGGTATAIVLADILGLPVFNLANADAKDRFVEHVRKILLDMPAVAATPEVDYRPRKMTRREQAYAQYRHA